MTNIRSGPPSAPERKFHSNKMVVENSSSNAANTSSMYQWLVICSDSLYSSRSDTKFGCQQAAVGFATMLRPLLASAQRATCHPAPPLSLRPSWPCMFSWCLCAARGAGCSNAGGGAVRVDVAHGHQLPLGAAGPHARAAAAAAAAQPLAPAHGAGAGGGGGGGAGGQRRWRDPAAHAGQGRPSPGPGEHGARSRGGGRGGAPSAQLYPGPLRTASGQRVDR